MDRRAEVAFLPGHCGLCLGCPGQWWPVPELHGQAASGALWFPALVRALCHAEVLF